MVLQSRVSPSFADTETTAKIVAEMIAISFDIT
jgi:hypothetical protein